jgi:hypothetical protein
MDSQQIAQPTKDFEPSMQVSLTWPVVITLSMAVVEILVYNDVATPLRPWITMWFLLVCPGMAYVRLLHISDAVSEFVLAVALSLVLALLSSAAVLYAGLWSPELILMLLIGLSMVGVGCQLFLWLRARTQEGIGQT